VQFSGHSVTHSSSYLWKYWRERKISSFQFLSSTLSILLLSNFVICLIQWSNLPRYFSRVSNKWKSERKIDNLKKPFPLPSSFSPLLLTLILLYPPSIYPLIQSLWKRRRKIYTALVWSVENGKARRNAMWQRRL
jgi:hypothetical protein